MFNISDITRQFNEQEIIKSGLLKAAKVRSLLRMGSSRRWRFSELMFLFFIREN